MRYESKKIVADILGYIQTYSDRDSLATELDPQFNQLALELFRFQYEWNPSYKLYCQRRRKSPFTVKRWQDIPPVPFQMFKESTLACEPVDEAEAVFMTSGSTNQDKRGRNYHATLEVWDASMLPPFKHYVLPDREKMTIFILSPAADVHQNSSLSRYLTMAVEHYGTQDSAFFFDKNTGFNMEGLVEALQQIESKGEPVLLMGATFAYVHFLDYCRSKGLTFKLPTDSRIFDTGGLKGQAREVTSGELYEWFKEALGVGRELCLNMYGMTELSSQLYDRVIETRIREGRPCYDKIGPAWTRIQVLSPDTLAPVQFGETGLLAHYDLANWNSALGILTEDIGYQTKDGFVLLGRTKGSEARGCSIAIDEMLTLKTNVNKVGV